MDQSSPMSPPETAPHRTEAQQKAQRSRSLALGVGLGAVVIIYYFITLFVLGPQTFNRPSLTEERAAARQGEAGTSGAVIRHE